MSDGFYCPVDSCEKHHENWTDGDAPFSSQKGVRMHIYAKSDEDHHDAEERGAWTEAEPNPLEEGDGDDQEDTDEGDSTSTDGDRSDGDTDSSDMVDPAEYEQQHQQQNDADDGGAGSASSSGGSSMPVSPQMTLMIVCAVFAAIVIWRVMESRLDSSDPVTATEESSDGGDGGEIDREDVPLFEA